MPLVRSAWGVTCGRIAASEPGRINNVSFVSSLENGVDVTGAFTRDFLTVPAR